MIFKKDGLYLSAFYTWVRIPHRFPVWQVGSLFEMFMGWRDKPTHFAEVRNTVDLDTVQWLDLSVMA
jgi:hypothetical protein